jgi:hypothetical protein
MGYANIDYVTTLQAISPQKGINPYKNPELYWQGWLKLTGYSWGNQGYGPRIEFGGLDNNLYAQQIVGAIANGSDVKDGYFSHMGFDFVGINLAGVTTPPTVTPAFSIGTWGGYLSQNPFVATAPLGISTSNSTNQASIPLMLVSSVWNGTTAKWRPAYLDTTQAPGATGNDATQEFRVRFYDRAMDDSNRAIFPVETFHITDVGQVFFGFNQSYYATHIGVNMDPSLTTAIRNVTWPDTSGGNLVVASSSSAPANSNAAGTPGTVMQDGTSVYICYAANKWVKCSGTFTF